MEPPGDPKQSMDICKLVFTFLFTENCHLSCVFQGLGWDIENVAWKKSHFPILYLLFDDLLVNEDDAWFNPQCTVPQAYQHYYKYKYKH